MRSPSVRPQASQSSEDIIMNKNRIEGTARQMKGIVREAVGRATGSRGTQMRGTAEKIAGKMQAKLGAAADSMRRVKK
jgi:uncharacterized protein YjbJ (UPF0337 family)